MTNTRQEIETQALYVLEKDSDQSDDTTTPLTPVGDTAAPTIRTKRKATGTPTAKKTQVDQPAVYHMSNPAAAIAAYAAIKAVYARVQFDLRNLKSVLLEEGLIEDYDAEDEYSSSNESVDVFIDAK
ncbi:uncharacterized protein N7479_002372 [Penicillium vulpinum]|uniref:uncharacterized protein n=1 Tax=Penicillium vulpinum TaxID=29845 RepID=UPI0025486FD3|nr:uncharacterized protein N7479_002372 [Penicillium vulpinum]KAJ5972454.1 hypothetical protein N7479_002372 [Penicillium vulpinum]